MHFYKINLRFKNGFYFDIFKTVSKNSANKNPKRFIIETYTKIWIKQDFEKIKFTLLIYII